MTVGSRLFISSVLVLIWIGAALTQWGLHNQSFRMGNGAVAHPAVVSSATEDAVTAAYRDTTGQRHTIKAEYAPVAGVDDGLEPGHRIFVGVPGETGLDPFVAGRVREPYLIALVAVFLSVLVIVGWQEAPHSLLVLAAVPAGTVVLVRLIAGGMSPLAATGLCAGLFSVIIAGLLSGVHRRTLAIVAGALAGLALAACLSILVSQILLLTGVHSSFTQDLWYAARDVGAVLDLRELLMAGMLFGALGVVIDLATAVASSVFEVAEVNTSLSRRRLAVVGLRVGRDVMSTEINTLIFAYGGAQIGLLLLPFYGPRGYTLPILQILSLPDVAAEVGFMVVGTVGLILTIPLTALAAAVVAPRSIDCHDLPLPVDKPQRRQPRAWWLSAALWTILALGCFLFYRGQSHAYTDVYHASADANLVRFRVASAEPDTASLRGGRHGEGTQVVAGIIQSGPAAGEPLTLHNPISGYPGHDKIARQGQTLLVKTMAGSDRRAGVVIDYDRGPALIGLAWAVGMLVMMVGGMKGVRALVALALCGPILGAAIFGVAAWGLPAVPVLAAAALLLCLAVFVVLAGPTRKAMVAAGGAFGGIAAGGIAAVTANALMHFTGLQSHSLYAIRMFDAHGARLDFAGLLTGGILLGIIGVAMDVAIGVTSCAGEIVDAGGAARRELWRRGMNIGRKIMCTMVLALLFAYLGANLSLLMLPAFARSMVLRQALNSELFAGEIVRIAAGAIGVVLTIPATALLAVLLYGRESAGGRKGTT